MALNRKQRIALELLTSGEGMKLQDIANEAGVNVKTLYNWRHLPEHAEFQSELKRINDERWEATVDAARAAALRLVANDNQKMVQFVLQNAGYNPTQKVEADINTDIIINIDE